MAGPRPAPAFPQVSRACGLVGRRAGGQARARDRRRDHPRRPRGRTDPAARDRDNLHRRVRGDAAPPPGRDGRLPGASSEVVGWRRKGRPPLRPLLQRKGDVDANVCALAAACLGAEGDYTEAARIDRLLCDAQPNNPQAWHSLGYDLFHAGDLEGAAEAFSRALKLEPTRASAHFNLARIAARLGDKSKVIEHFARAVELQPDYQERLDEDPDLLPFKDDPEMLGRLPGGKVGEDPYQEYYATRS